VVETCQKTGQRWIVPKLARNELESDRGEGGKSSLIKVDECKDTRFCASAVIRVSAVALAGHVGEVGQDSRVTGRRVGTEPSGIA